MLSEAVLEQRKKGLGGSDIAAICGLSPWKSAYQVWLDKTGRSNGQEQNDAMAYGTMIEPVIRHWYEQHTGQKVNVPSRILVHPTHDFMLANLDGHTEDRVIEIKTARSNSDWGKPGTDEVPPYYLTQGHHYMMVSGFELVDFVVSFAGTMPVVYTVEADAEIQDMLLEKESEFWNMVKSDTPPPPTTLQDMLLAFPQSKGISVTASAQIEASVSRMKAIKHDIKKMEGEEEKIRAEIMAAMGEADTLTDLARKPLVTWKSGKSSSVFDSKTFQEVHPDLYRKFTIEKSASRRFLVK